jgi:hypothetical protein
LELGLVVSEKLITAAELAERPVPVTWVRDSTRSGVIRHVALGRYKHYRQADVEKWLAACSKHGRPIALR